MPFAPETVALNGSGLVFNNSYGTNVSAAYRTAVIAAENFFQSHFTNAVTLNMSFDFLPLSGFTATNNWFSQTVGYTSLVTALRAHATTADDFAAIASLPGTDPSGGRGFSVANGMARILGLASPANGGVDDKVILNSNMPFTFGQDALGAIEHEISEGAMGRIGGLGFLNGGNWGPMDLLRYTAGGQHDYTGGRDGQTTFFSVDGRSILTQFQFHSSVNTSGAYDGNDLADWDHTVGDAFGPGGPTSPALVSATDLRLMDILGWTPTGSSPAPGPGDDFCQCSGRFPSSSWQCRDQRREQRHARDRRRPRLVPRPADRRRDLYDQSSGSACGRRHARGSIPAAARRERHAPRAE